MDVEYSSQLRHEAPASVKISIDSLETEFQCTVCLNAIDDAYITRCGHVFCRGCIEETINRHHRCPFCNQELKEFKADVFKNYHFNTIRKIVDEEKAKETKKYVEKVFASDSVNRIELENKEIEELLAPIEKKIVQSCQKALLEYRKFLITLYNLQKQAEERKALLQSAIIRDHSTIIKQINSYIMEKVPNPVLSPEIIEKTTQVHITLPGNKLNKNMIKLAPMATFQSLLPYIEKICSENNVMMKGKIANELTINGIKVNIKQKIGLLSGNTIKIEKGLPFQQKVYCHTYNWDKQKASNFHICSTCNVKWICEACILHCHHGHETKLQLKDHKSDWAICYCVTKCTCKALNKSNLGN